MLAAKLMASFGDVEKPYSDDVFSAYTYTGNNSVQNIVNRIDLASNGGAVFTQSRDGQPVTVSDSVFGLGYRLNTYSTNAPVAYANSVNSFNSNGYTLGTDPNMGQVNFVGYRYVGWTFRQAPKFFLNTTVTKSSGSNATVDLSSLGTVGMVMVKRTDAAGSWYVFHRSATAGKLLYLEQLAAEATLGHITVSGTTLTLVNGVIADGSYVVYAWAHDSSADGIIQCGSFTHTAGAVTTVSLGFEPQFLNTKNATAIGNWSLADSTRGLYADATSNILKANTADAEIVTTVTNINANGFSLGSGNSSGTYIYVAIRRSNKPPTLGTQVYNAIARTGTGAAATVTGVGFAPDLCITKKRSSTTLTGARFTDRLRGKTLHLDSTATTAEVNTADTVSGFDVMDGFVLGADATTSAFNTSGHTYVNHFFKRAPGVFSILCDTGTAVNKLENHNLGSIPELMIRKGRSGATQWEVYFSSLGNTKKLVLNSTAAEATDTTAWNSTSPTSTQVSIGTGSNVNTNAATYVTYLFATLAGISKCGSYTGNGTNQTINCGFTTGSRFVMVKRVDVVGDWFVWDSVRGIVAGNDPHLSLNTTAAEVTTDDSIDPDTSGFIVNQLAATNINVSAASYIFLAFA